MIKRLLRRLVEKLTGRKCSRCVFNHCGHCNLRRDEYMKCFHSITLPNFQKRPPRYLRAEKERKQYEEYGRLYAEGLKAGMEVKPAPLTPEQKYQLEKIKATLRDAEDMARESGLLTEG